MVNRDKPAHPDAKAEEAVLKPRSAACEPAFRDLVQAVTDYAIFALDPNGYILTWNKGAERLKGYRPDEIIGQHFSIFYTAADIASQHPQEELKIAYAMGRFEEEGWRIKKDGSRFWGNISIQKIVDASGQFVGFAKVTRDLTERREALIKLQESEERFRLLVESVQDYAILTLDPQGYVMTWNLGAERIKGYKAAEIIGQHFSRFYTDEDLENEKPNMELRAAAEKGRFEDEGWRVRKDKGLFWANVVITALRDSKGILRGFAKVTRDLTARKRAEEKLQELNENLERKVLERTAELTGLTARLEVAVKARDEFLSVASHELKTPLTSLKLQVQMRKRAIKKRGDGAFTIDALRGMADDDERQISRLTRLVDDMLDINRLTSGKLSLNLEHVNLGMLADEVTQRMLPQLEACGCRLAMEHHGDVEGGWDPYRMEQVLTNLLTNAMKYGQGKPVRVMVRGSNQNVELSVEDHGLGIAPEHQERIFEQFERINASHAATGLGLGLYIVRQIVEEHGGRVYLRSKVGEGSTFVVQLPRREGS